MQTDNTLEGSWKFDASVAENFTDMLSRSIPDYENMRDLTFRIARRFLRPYSNVLDIGCSTGLSSQSLIESDEAKKVDFTLIDVSEPMLVKCRKRYKHNVRVDVCKWDIKDGCPVQKCSVVLSVLTLQFVPIEHRQFVVSSIYSSLQKGGALLLVEKVLGCSDIIDKAMVDEYYNIKKENSYTEDEILTKRKCLVGRLVPLTQEWNVSMLKNAGFSFVDIYWRYLNFCGIMAIK